MSQFTYVNKTLPLIPLRGISIFPHMVVHFDVGREKSISALEKSMMEDATIFLCSQKDAKINDPTVDDFYHIGTIAKIKQMLKLPGGSIRVLIEGINRGRIIEIIQEEPHFAANIEELVYGEKDVVKDVNMEAAMRLVINDFEEYLSYNDRISSDVMITVADIDDPGRLADVIASYIHLKLEDDQKILETFDLYERLELLHKILQEEIEVLKIEEKINQELESKLTKFKKNIISGNK